MLFSQSLTLDLGAVASPGRSNLNWVWHDHISVELVKAHYAGFVLALCFYGDYRRTCCTLSGINSEWYRQMIPFASTKLAHQKILIKSELAE